MSDNVYDKGNSGDGAPKRKRQRIVRNAVPVTPMRNAVPVTPVRNEPSASHSGVFDSDDVFNIKVLDKILTLHADDTNSFEVCGILIKKNREYGPFLKRKLGMDTRAFDNRRDPDALKRACAKMKRRIVDVILEDFKHNPTEEKRAAYNEILSQYGRKIEKIPDVKTDHNVQLVVRGAFEGEFKMPTHISTVNGEGFSKGYRNFANPHHEPITNVIAGGKLPADYDWSENPVVKALSLSKNMSRLIPDLQAAVRNQRIPLSVVEGLSVSDVGHILYKEKNGGKSPDEQQKIPFKSLNNECDEGARIKFWKEFGKDAHKMENLKSLLESRGVSKEYVRDLLAQIKEKGTVTLDVNKYEGVIPVLSVHHKMYVQDAALLDNVMKIDDHENFTAVVDFPDEKNHKEFEHAADTKDAQGNAYRLINLKDTEKETVYLQAGLESYSEPRRSDYQKRETYRDFARGGYE